MKKWILALLPWMVAVAHGQSEGPSPAVLHFPHIGVESADAWQIGLECFVSVDTLRQAGWQVTLKGGEASIIADSKRATVAFRNQSGQAIVPIHALLKKLGAGGEWVPGTRTFSVHGIIKSVRVEREMVMVDATLPTKPKIFAMADPSRLVFDFENMRFEDSTTLVLPKEGQAGQFKPNTARLVIETELKPDIRPSKLSAAKNFTFNYGIPADPDSQLPEVDSTEKPLEIGTMPVASSLGNTLAAPPTVMMDTDTRTVLEFRFTRPLQAPPRINRPSVTEFQIGIDGVRYDGPANPILGARSIQAFTVNQATWGATLQLTFERAMGAEISQKGNILQVILIRPKFSDPQLSTKTIVIDPGHGGKDGGARAPDGSVNEKTLALKIAKNISQALTSEGATIIMTRDSDVFIPLNQRPEVANKSGADLFISVHINSSNSVNSTSGTIVFYHKRDTVGKLLAECLSAELGKVSKLKNLGAWSDQRIYDSGFAVLRGAGMPAVLLELGFINHSTDRARIVQESYASDVANALVKGIKVFLGNE